MKTAELQESFRILKRGGHFSISDIILMGELPKTLQEDAEMYADCVSGAIQKEQYLSYIKDSGFPNLSIQKEKPIRLPADILSKYLSAEEIAAFENGTTGIFSITAFAQKLGGKQKKIKLETEGLGNTCAPGAGCC